ncbi:hypothetical protein J2S13_000714 [Oikeobacillus pervagus]|uniref:Flagellar hook-length control protein FliK n=1 Tax=Oikeobacillus pervagus TaxID=1325931 RepID=A0AAJ1WIG3_9BACI|nr:hypothetical protein [Oikeobacillus pervagus]MDQ0214318.1 hypothetical protein [Oikeobacillus pervagus]
MQIQSKDQIQLLFAKGKTQYFREGQIFSGKVAKFLSKGMAEISVGGQKMVAKLEAPLTTRGTYVFTVTSTVDGVHLRVLTSSIQNQQPVTEQADELLQQLSLENTKESKILTMKLLQEGWPSTKSMLNSASEWLTNGDLKEGIKVIKYMVEQSLPFTKEIFLSLQSLGSTKTFTNLFESLASCIRDLPNKSESMNSILNIYDQWKHSIENQLAKSVLLQLMEILTDENYTDRRKEVVVQLLKEWGTLSKGITAQQAPAMMLQNWLAKPLPHDDQFHSFHQVLKQWGFERSESEYIKRLENELRALFNGGQIGDKESIAKMSQQAVYRLINANPVDINRTSAEILQLILSVEENVRTGSPSLELLASIFKQNETDIHRLFSNEIKKIANTPLNLQTARQKLIQQLWFNAENKLQNEWNGRNALALMKTSFQLMGIDLEGQLSNKEYFQDSLKSNLIKLLIEPIPAQVREIADTLVHRMNAQHILSGENGPLQHLIMQIPISLFQWSTDLTIQWSGKQMENGELDPDYCRILFYLDLQFLKETVIDMHVQNRMITIQIFNEQEKIKQVAQPFLPSLKERLQKMGYQLSDVTFHQKERLDTPTLIQLTEEKSYVGVDIRI